MASDLNSIDGAANACDGVKCLDDAVRFWPILAVCTKLLPDKPGNCVEPRNFYAAVSNEQHLRRS